MSNVLEVIKGVTKCKMEEVYRMIGEALGEIETLISKGRISDLFLALLPIVFSILIFLFAIIVKVTEKKEKGLAETFYGKKWTLKKRQSIYSNLRMGIDMAVICGAFLVVLIVAIDRNLYYSSYINEMIEKIDMVSDVIVGFTAISVTMLVFVLTFNKEYYIAFTIREVLEHYKIKECLYLVISSCMLTVVLSFSLLDGKIDSYSDAVRFLVLELSAVCNLMGVTYILIRVVGLIFGNEKSDLKLLNQLYRRFWVRDVDTKSFKKVEDWRGVAVRTNLEYLLNEYICSCKRKKIVGISEIEFVTTQGCYKERWSKKAMFKFIITMFAFTVVGCLIGCLLLKNCGICFLNIVVALGMSIIACLNNSVVRMTIMQIFVDVWGYYIKTIKGKEQIVWRVSIFEGGKYQSYIRKMNNLNAFFYIWVNMGHDFSNEAIKEFFVDMIAELKEFKDNYEASPNELIVFFPVFTIGYFLFENKINVDELIELYRKIILNAEERWGFDKMIYSQLFYLTKEFPGDLLELQASVSEYLRWLKSVDCVSVV